MTIAGVAAFFSISGLGSLFAGAFMAVVIMASALEAGKLVTASFLTRHWKDLTVMLRFYYILATTVLIVITSAGIYGFLTAAYQTTADQLSIVDQQVNVLELRKERYQEQLDLYSGERERISETILQLTEGLTNNQIQYVDQETGQLVTSTSRATREAIQQQLDNATQERDEVSDRIEEATDSITSLDIQRIDLQANNEVAAEIGPLRYLSNLTGWSMDKVVNIFALLIVFVFDPLAVSLIVGYNRLAMLPKVVKDEKKYEIYKEVEENEPTKEETIEMLVDDAEDWVQSNATNDNKIKISTETEPVRVGWEEAAAEASERYKNTFAELAKHDINETVTEEEEPLDKEGDTLLSLESKAEVDFQPPKRDHWGLGRQP